MIVETIAMNRIIATIKIMEKYFIECIACMNLHSPTATKLTINNIIAISLSESSYINKINYFYTIQSHLKSFLTISGSSGRLPVFIDINLYNY